MEVGEAWQLLKRLVAPPRLLHHAELVSEAAQLLLAGLGVRAQVDARFVQAGTVLHDVGKIQFPEELNAKGAAHESAGEALLLSHRVEPDLARVCRSHAQWAALEVSLEELLIALADKLWKGVRKSELEGRVIDGIAARSGVDRWELFVELDSLFERIAAGGDDRLARSRAGVEQA